MTGFPPRHKKFRIPVEFGLAEEFSFQDRTWSDSNAMKTLLLSAALVAALSTAVLSPAVLAPSGPTSKLDAKQFVIFFYETPTGFAHRTGPKATEYWKGWTGYIGSLQTSGAMESGAALLPPAQSAEADASGTRKVSAKGIQLSGYVVVKASTLNDALALAKKSPAIASGGKVEVREVLPMTQHKGGA
jgi:hypothetical protein